MRIDSTDLLLLWVTLSVIKNITARVMKIPNELKERQRFLDHCSSFSNGQFQVNFSIQSPYVVFTSLKKIRDIFSYPVKHRASGPPLKKCHAAQTLRGRMECLLKRILYLEQVGRIRSFS